MSGFPYKYYHGFSTKLWRTSSPVSALHQIRRCMHTHQLTQVCCTKASSDDSEKINMKISAAGFRKSRKFLLNNDSLESRCVPATFGIPWPNSDRLTISFAPDETTKISGQSNTLNRTLDNQFSTMASLADSPSSLWKKSVLQAFELWGSETNLNFGIVSDSGLEFGTSGQAQGDSRFGDIRIAGIPLASNALAVSMPFDPGMAGTSSGDLIFNTSIDLNHSPDELLRIALHEVGHTLGLPTSYNPESVMSSPLGTRTTLDDSDILAIQNLYGKRNPDIFDTKSVNDTPSNATRLKPQMSQNSIVPVIAYGDITNSSDVDYYSIEVPSKYSGQMTLKLQSGGISLLNANISVMDEKGALIGRASIQDIGGGSASIVLPSVISGSKLMVKIESISSNAFQVGAYGLAASFDNATSVTPERLSEYLKGFHSGLGSEELANQLINGSSNSANNAQGQNNHTTYNYTGRFEDSNSTDTFQINGDPDRGSVLTVRAYSVGTVAVNPEIEVTKPDGKVIPSKILINDNGQMTVQLTGITGSEPIRIRLKSETGQIGNYQVETFFTKVPSETKTFLSGQLTSLANTQNYKFYVAQSQAFQFLNDLNLESGSDGTSRLEASVIDSWGRVVWAMQVGSGLPESNQPVILNTGEYRFQMKLVTTSSTPVTASFRLSGTVISDPVGPGIIDGTTIPQYSDPLIPPTFTYPGGIIMPDPYFWSPILDPFYDPYLSTDSGRWLA